MAFPTNPSPGDSYTDEYGTVWVYAGTVNGWYRQEVSTPNDTSYTAAISGPAGSNTQVQFNDNGELAGDSGLTYNKTTDALSGGAFIPTGSTVPTNGLYRPSANNVAISTSGTGRLFVDANGSVGLSTTPVANVLIGGARGASAPALLELAGNGNTVGSTGFIFGQDGNGLGVVYQRANAAIYFATNSTERLRITSDGKLGLATSTPDALLTVNGVGAHGLGSASAPSFAFTGDLNTGIYSPGADQVAISTNGTGRLFVDSSGNIAIGATTATDKLDLVGGGFRIQRGADSDNILRIDGEDGSTEFLTLGVTGGDAVITGAGAGSTNTGLVFRTASGGTEAERLRITSDGKLGLGTSSPGSLLDVGSGSATGVTQFTLKGGSTAGDYGIFSIQNGSTSRGRLVADAGVDELRIDTAGGASTKIQFKTGSSYANALTIDASQRVGVGITSPFGDLDVDGVRGIYSRGSTEGLIALDDKGVADGSTPIRWMSSNGGSHIFYAANRNASGGTTGSVEHLRITSDGKVGLGTSSPGSLLTLKQTTAASSDTAPTLIKLENGSDGGSAIEFSNAVAAKAKIALGVEGTGAATDDTFIGFSTSLDTALSEKVRITSAGNVGVGTTSPGQLLHLKGSTPIIYMEPAANTETAYLSFVDTSGSTRGFVGYNFNDDALITRTAGSERARIDSSGRLLVGTSSARDKFFNTSGQQTLFQVERVGLSGTQSYQTASFITNSSDGVGAYVTLGASRGTAVNSYTVLQSGDTIGKLAFQGADGTELVSAAEITAQADGTPGANDMPGRLVFSTTADGASSPTERMRIGNSGTQTQYAESGDSLFLDNADAAGTARRFIGARYGATGIGSGTISFQVFTNGNVQNTNNSYTAISDIKLKENIVDANSQWDDIKALRPVNYNFKEGQTHTQIGLIAQEVELVSPGLVYESPDRDEDGNDLGTVTKSVNYSVLYMKAVKALQEAMDRIETLEAKVAALETP